MNSFSVFLGRPDRVRRQLPCPVGDNYPDMGGTRGCRLELVIAELRRVLLGWKVYSGITKEMSFLCNVNKWICEKLPCNLWKQGRKSGYPELRKLGDLCKKHETPTKA